MTLKELIIADFGITLPISGGFGNSIENPIIIHNESYSSPVETERIILDCLGKGRNIKWKIILQELLTQDNKTFDKIKIETIEETDTEIITQIENYYFDITEYFNNKLKKDNAFDEEFHLALIRERLMELEKMNDFNKECISLLKADELHGNTELLSKFIEVICKDESLTLFESMWENSKKPIMQVLKIVGKKLI